MSWISTVLSSSALSNDAWFGFAAVTLAVLTWAHGEPTSNFGQHKLYPAWLGLFAVTSVGMFCFLIDYVRIGKFIVLVQASLVMGLALVVITLYPFSHRGPLRWMREKNIHAGIGSEPYFGSPP